MRIYTTTDFILSSISKHNNELLSYEKTIFTSKNSKVIITCKLHGDFEQIAKIHLKGHSCPQCGHNYRANLNRLTTEHFINDANKIHNFFFSYDNSFYIGRNRKITITCPFHGEFNQMAGNHLNGFGCPSCSGCKKLTTEEFVRKANIKHNFKFDYSKSIYIGAHSKVIISCPEHGEFTQKPNCHLSGAGCPVCKESKGEREIRINLKELKMNFKYQYSFKNCKNIKPLPFDFALFNNKKLIGLIEYQGIQHYKVGSFGSK